MWNRFSIAGSIQIARIMPNKCIYMRPMLTNSKQQPFRLFVCSCFYRDCCCLPAVFPFVCCACLLLVVLPMFLLTLNSYGISSKTRTTIITCINKLLIQRIIIAFKSPFEWKMMCLIIIMVVGIEIVLFFFSMLCVSSTIAIIRMLAIETIWAAYKERYNKIGAINVIICVDSVDDSRYDQKIDLSIGYCSKSTNNLYSTW